MPERRSILISSLVNLAILLAMLRCGGLIRIPWWLVAAPLWVVPVAVAIAVLAVMMLVGAWAIDELNGAREKAARDRTTDDDWARWR